MSADGHALPAGTQVKSLPLDPWVTAELTPHLSDPATTSV